MNKKRVAINMTAQLLAFGVNMLLGFILVPIIESMIPNAYGFTDIANKFVSAGPDHRVGPEYHGQPVYYYPDSPE